MLRVLIVSLFVVYCNAGSGYSAGGSYGGAPTQVVTGGNGGYGGSSGYGGGLAFAAPAAPAAASYDAAIQTRRTVEVRPVAYQQDFAQPQIIEVAPEELPVQVHFRTASSRVNVHQSHTPGLPAQVEHASFQDEPHRVIHEVIKPVIQEVREIIQPYRRVTQEIRPVIEEVHTVVHKGEKRQQLPLLAPQQIKLAPAAPSYGAPSGGFLNAGYKGAKAKAARA